MRGLIVDEPWIGLILRGQKVWEMRRTACKIRGRIALIRKGSGQVVGIADIHGSLPEIASADEYALAERQHRIPPERQGRAFADGWRTPWVLDRARALTKPVPYEHPLGAVIWVQLGAEVAAVVEAQAGRVDRWDDRARPLTPQVLTAAARAPAPLPSNSLTSDAPVHFSALGGPPGSEPEKGLHIPAGTVRRIRITGGNVRNHHIYLPLDFFPQDAIGGSNTAERAPRTLTVTFDPGRTVTTDIDRTKRILRERGAVADFLTRTQISAGDEIVVRCLAPYQYEISKAVHD